MEDRLQTLVQKIRQHGHRLTPQRMAILRILADSTGHPTVEQVYEQVRAQFPMTSLATVYKTVTLLKEEGEILELSFGGESSRYDGHNPQPHPHLICIRCGTILDPDLALFSGADGLDALRVVAQVARRLLRPGGLVCAEHDDTHGASAPALFAERGFTEVTDHLDLAGRPRFVTARAAGTSPGRMSP